MSVQSSIQAVFKQEDELTYLTVAEIARASGLSVASIVAALFNLQGGKIEGVQPAHGQWISEEGSKIPRWRATGALKNSSWGVATDDSTD